MTGGSMIRLGALEASVTSTTGVLTPNCVAWKVVP